MESAVKNIITMTALAAVLAACASAPQRNDQLERARTEVQTLSAEPLAQQAASGDLDAARASLSQADSAFQQKLPPEKVNQLAYLAMRHAEAGEARISEARARQEVARGQQDRDRILMQAREREAQNAQTQAAVAQNQAAAAQGELADAQKELADLKAKQTDRGLVMTLGDVLFDTGRATLKPGADRDMDRLGRRSAPPPQVRYARLLRASEINSRKLHRAAVLGDGASGHLHASLRQELGQLHIGEGVASILRRNEFAQERADRRCGARATAGGGELAREETLEGHHAPWSGHELMARCA
jgi:hypothetical protein